MIQENYLNKIFCLGLFFFVWFNGPIILCLKTKFKQEQKNEPQK
jgi:hypothetical protein